MSKRAPHRSRRYVRVLGSLLLLLPATACDLSISGSAEVSNNLNGELGEFGSGDFGSDREVGELETSVGAAGVTVNWGQPDMPGIESYNIYRAELASGASPAGAPSLRAQQGADQQQPAYVKVGSTSEPPFLDQDVRAGATYAYGVAAVVAGNEMARSEVAVVDVPRDFVLDATPPETTIDSGPDPIVAETEAQFTFSCDEEACAFECSLDGSAFVACASPKSYSGLADGDHNFSVRAIDDATNKDASPAFVDWTVDATAPDTTIDAGPAERTESNSAEFAFSSDEPGAAFQCRVDGDEWEDCPAAPTFTGFALGGHQLSVRAVDAAGNQDDTPETWSWDVVLDATPPGTQIDSGPSGTVASDQATFTFSCTEAGCSFQCSRDDGPFAACTSPKAYTDLSDGSHSFAVRALDGAGNADPTPATRSWSVDAGGVDTSAPETTLDSGPDGFIETDTAQFTFSCDEAGCAFLCGLNAAPTVPCTSPKVYNGLSDGGYTFSVAAVDGAGNDDPTPAFSDFDVDTQEPQSSVDSQPGSPNLDDGGTFTFSCNETGCSYECAIDTAPFAACTSPHVVDGQPDGVRTFAVRAIDQAGNVESSPSEATWEVGAAPPAGGVTAPVALTRFTALAGVQLWAADPNGGVEVRLGGAIADAIAGQWIPLVEVTAVTLTGGDGAKAITAEFRDRLGNTAAPVSDSVELDQAPPETAIDGGPPAEDIETEASVAFSSADGVTFECQLDEGGFAPCASPVVYGGLLLGEHTVEVRAIDGAGNVDPTPAAHVWEKTMGETYFTQTPGPYTAFNFPEFALASTAVDLDHFECSVDYVAFTDCTSPHSVFHNSGALKSLRIRGVDSYGNIDPSPAEHQWRYDGSAPINVGLDAPDGASTTAVAVGPQADDLQPAALLEMKLDGDIIDGFAGQWVPFSAGGTTVTLTLGEGPKTVGITVRDSVLNTSGQITTVIVYDETPPETVIDSGPPAATDDVAADFQFSSPDADVVRFECSLDGADWFTCAADHSYDAVPYSGHTLRVRAVDIGGNPDPTPAAHNWSLDPLAPRPATLAVGEDHTCTVRSDGTLWCWGYNAYYQLGDGTTTNRGKPRQIGSDSDWHGVYSGSDSHHTCGIRTDGSLWCWGFNSSGQVGTGDSTNVTEPTRIGNDSDWLLAGLGSHHTCALKTDGTAWCWADDWDEELGTEAATGLPEPVTLSDGENVWTDLAVHAVASCGIRPTREIRCWGSGSYIGVGQGADTTADPQPVADTAGQQWEQVVGGSRHMCARRADGTVWCWGYNDGYLNIDEENFAHYQPVSRGTSGWTHVAPGATHTCLLDGSGNVHCWGDNDWFRLGIGGGDDLYTSPQEMLDDTTGAWTDVRAGNEHSCGLKDNGDLYCWGSNRYGQAGAGAAVFSPITMAAAPVTGGHEWTQLAGGYSSTCGVTAGSGLHCWGENRNYSLGTGALDVDYDAPQAITEYGSFVTVAHGTFHGCGIRDDGLLYCWGLNNYGQLGDGTTSQRPNPTQVDGNTWRSVGAGDDHSCGVRTDGTLWCWGRGGFLGDGTDSQSLNPVQESGGDSDWLEVAVGSGHSCGRKTTGRIYCWTNLDLYGLVGDGNPGFYKRSPQELAGSVTTWTSIDAGRLHSCATRSDGSLYCWGRNSSGAIGNGSQSGPSSCYNGSSYEPCAKTPFRVGTDNDWDRAYAGYERSCGIKADGSLWCWGSNNSGQLGVGHDNHSVLTPEQEATGANWSSVELGAGSFSTSCGIQSGGVAHCWGGNFSHEHGTGSYTVEGPPAKVWFP